MADLEDWEIEHVLIVLDNGGKREFFQLPKTQWEKVDTELFHSFGENYVVTADETEYLKDETELFKVLMERKHER